ncbi:MAG: DUF6149 family protein [Haloarculaceae archaeon]
MKLKQDLRHFAAKKALTVPIAGERIRAKLVEFHTDYFLDLADPEDREARRDHLEAFFDATFDAYLAALDAGYPEAEAREITHVQSAFDFYNHGWTEMMEFPVDEIEDHYDRYESFFEAHGVTIADPLGEFEPEAGIPPAPSTPERLEDPEHPHAEGGFADDVYVEDEDGSLHVGGRDDAADLEEEVAD